MIVVLAYILNLFAPIVNILGVFGLCGCIVYDDWHMLGIAAPLAVVGLIFGIFAFRNDIPPRWFWSQSKNDLFAFSVTAVLGYAMNFAAWPLAIYLITTIMEMLGI